MCNLPSEEREDITCEFDGSFKSISGAITGDFYGEVHVDSDFDTEPLKKDSNFSLGADAVCAAIMIDSMLYQKMYGNKMQHHIYYYPLSNKKIDTEIRSPYTLPKPNLEELKKVSIMGVGGVGHWITTLLSLTDIPLEIIDGDRAEVHNFTRQFFYGRRTDAKVNIMADILKKYTGKDIDTRDEFVVGENFLESKKTYFLFFISLI